MSRFTHAICDRCWDQLEPGRTPTRVIDSTRYTCCFCGVPASTDGIFVRRAPDEVGCAAKGGYHDEGDTGG